MYNIAAAVAIADRKPAIADRQIVDDHVSLSEKLGPIPLEDWILTY